MKKYLAICSILFTVCTAFTGSMICLALIWVAGIEMPVAIGMMTGAFTSSPGFAAAKEAVSALGSLGIISGFPDGSFKPEEVTTRAQAAVVFARFLELMN